MLKTRHSTRARIGGLQFLRCGPQKWIRLPRPGPVGVTGAAHCCLMKEHSRMPTKCSVTERGCFHQRSDRIRKPAKTVVINCRSACSVQAIFGVPDSSPAVDDDSAIFPIHFIRTEVPMVDAGRMGCLKGTGDAGPTRDPLDSENPCPSIAPKCECLWESE